VTPAKHRLLFGIRIAVWVIVGTCVVVFARRLDWTVFGSFEGADFRLALCHGHGLPCTALQGLRWASVINAVRKVPRITAVAAMYVGQAASAFSRCGRAKRCDRVAGAGHRHRPSHLARTVGSTTPSTAW